MVRKGVGDVRITKPTTRLRKEAGRCPEGETWPHKASAKAKEQPRKEGPRNMGAAGGKPQTDGTLPMGTDTKLHYMWDNPNERVVARGARATQHGEKSGQQC